MSKNIYFLIFILFFSNCYSQKIEKKVENPQSIPFEVYSYYLEDKEFNKYLIYITKLGFVLNFKEKYQSEECFVICSGKRIDFAPVQIETKDEYPIVVPAWLYSVETKKDLQKESCSEIKFVANRTTYSLPLNFVETNQKFEAFPQVIFHDDTTVVFVLDLLRLKPIEDEYFPTSERLRIEIRNSVGKVVWNSDYDLNFLQVIGQVEPAEVGKMHRYIMPWNRQDNFGRFVEKGEFNVAYILPIKPHSIIRNIKLKLETQ